MNQLDKITKEGTFNFWIRIASNPEYSNASSNITFLKDKRFGPITLTVLKQKKKIYVKLSNPEYGTAEFSENIGSYLGKDTMVTITWRGNIVKLHLNGNQVEEINTKDVGNVGEYAIFDVSRLESLPTQGIEAGIRMEGKIIEVKETSFIVDFSKQIKVPGNSFKKIEISKSRKI